MLQVAQWETYVKEKKYIEGLRQAEAIIRELRQQGSLRAVKEWLAARADEEEVGLLVRLLDEGMMYAYSGFLARYAHRRFRTLRTAVWIADEWVAEGRPLDAEDLLREEIARAENSGKGKEHLQRAYFMLARCLLEMRRYEEASVYMKQAEARSETPFHDRWGYYYMCKGEWERAEEELLAGQSHPERADVARRLLAQLYAGQGRHEEALAQIEEGIDRFPEIPSFRFERVKRLHALKRYEALLAEMAHIDGLLSFHEFRPYFAHLRLEALYELGDEEGLQQQLADTAISKGLPYHHLAEHRHAEKVLLPIVPIVQKDNYCVPASVAMMLRLFGETLTQDEIAAHIFDVTGSSLAETVRYMEEHGYACRLFRGTPSAYKQLMHAGIPVLLSVEYDHAAHVQVIRGFNDELQSLYVQDPNSTDTWLITYEQFAEQHANTDYLSIAVAPAGRKEELAFLPEAEHVYFRGLFEHIQLMEANPQQHAPAFIAFLQANMHIAYTWLYAVKCLGAEGGISFVQECADRLLAAHPDSDYVKMHIAQCWIRLHEDERAEEMLQQVKRKTRNPLYHYLCGRLQLHHGKYREAVASFRASLQIDPDQPTAWSYMALAYSYEGNTEEAQKKSAIAQERHKSVFTVTNHGLILMHNDQYAEAYELFQELIKDNKQEAHIWYERARCARALGKARAAQRGLHVSIALEPTAPYAYLVLSELYEEELGDAAAAEAIARQGIQAVDNPADLHLRLGDLYRSEERFDEAAAAYETCLQHDAAEVYAHLGIIDVHIKQEDLAGARAYVRDVRQQFAEDSDFLIRAGRMLLQAGQEAYRQLWEWAEGLDLLEEGIRHAEYHVASALELYVQFAENPLLVERGISFLREQAALHPDDIQYACYLGVLHESVGQYDEALALYKQAASCKTRDTFPHYRLGEVYLALERLQPAKNAFHTCVSWEPDFTNAHLKLAMLFGLEGKHKSELKHLFLAMQSDPFSVDLERVAALSAEQGQYQDLLEFLGEMSGYVDEVWRLDALAYAHEAAGNRKEALLKLEQALQLEPKHPIVSYHYARMLVVLDCKRGLQMVTEMLQQDVERESLYRLLLDGADRKLTTVQKVLKNLPAAPEERSRAFMYAAAAALDIAIEERDAHESEAHSFLSSIWKRVTGSGKNMVSFGRVFALFEAALEQDPANHAAVQRLADLYLEADMYSEAIKWLRRVLRQTWDFDTAFQFAAAVIASEQATEKELREALALMRKLQAEQPHNPHVISAAARLYMALEMEVEAERDLLREIEAVPYWPQAFLSLGNLYIKQGRLESAVQVLERGRRYHHFYTPIYTELGVAYHRSGQTDLALALMDEALALTADDLLIKYNRACYLSVLHRVEEAAAELDAVLAADDSGRFAALAEEDPDLVNIRQ